ncbi:hypothetical protein CA223_06710 [Sphingomonas koreensis]|uniref:Uncharacterized protein n=1 Tax=Sphingomonas koreensis TaxID=93064 RepID=A0A1L6J8X1_9SPHN|nr:hypothetical protein [Sphingomonas koreensis]APR52010.1 hypothetical protein BRX40_05775 [Sphingomonas koreensis]RSU22813.1 hypothetical protein CA224_05390 [Sphingomonas koreensis]RSU30713.1 hypothetical protein CA222_01155 [Sphingomonas koreensis]RSU31808.1 hypothetical protein CA225_00235 [Sphingomonas koreensis]RSU39271.1 hypothetical protein BRX39_01295 [Sphingomonas koreensis]
MTVEISDAAAKVLLDIRAYEGSDQPISEGSAALATMVAETADELVMFSTAIGGFRSVERMIAGTMLPCQKWGEMLGQFTDGRITARMFGEEWKGALPERIEPQYEPESDPPPPGAPGAAALGVVRGRLGQVPSGPVFTHAVDPDDPGSFVISGLGLAIRLDEFSGFALRNALVAGLLDLRGDRPAQARQAA